MSVWRITLTLSLLVSSPVWSAPPAVKVDFRSATAEQPLTRERTVEIAPARLNPSRRAWAVESRWEWLEDSSTLQVNALLHVTDQAQCRSRALSEGQAALKRMQAYAQSRGVQAQKAAAQGSTHFRAWSDRTRESFDPGMSTLCETQVSAVRTGVKPKLLARAPMKLWGGRPSIRASLSAGGVTMSGQFLLDVGAAQSSVSPLFLDFQGVPSDWFVDPSRPALHLPWAYRYGAESFPADEGRMDDAQVANLSLPVRWFRVLESEIAEPPQSPGPCCDGVLGLDALRAYPVEWRMDEPYELLIWSREGFDPGSEYVAIAVEESADGVLQSPGCELRSSQAGGAARALPGVRWMTSRAQSLEFSAPHAVAAKTAASGAKNIWNLQCPLLDEGTAPFAQWSLPERADWSVARPPRARAHFPELDSKPAVALGTATFLRGRVILDLPHGRLWFQRKALELPPASGDWGGKFEYRLVEAGRVLWFQRQAGFARNWASDSATSEPPLGRWIRVHKINGRDPSGWDVSVMERVMRGMGQGAGAALDQGKLELTWSAASDSAAVQVSKWRWNARSSSQR